MTAESAMRVVHKSKNSKTVLEDDVDDISRYWKELGLEAFQASFSSDNWWIWVRLITINVIAWSTITLLLPRVFRARRGKTRSWCLERRRFRKCRRCGRWPRAEQSEMKPQLEWWWSGGFHGCLNSERLRVRFQLLFSPRKKTLSTPDPNR